MRRRGLFGRRTSARPGVHHPNRRFHAPHAAGRVCPAKWSTCAQRRLSLPRRRAGTIRKYDGTDWPTTGLRKSRIRCSTSAFMPRTFAATITGSPESSNEIRSASPRLILRARARMRLNSEGFRRSAARSRRLTSSPSDGTGRRLVGSDTTSRFVRIRRRSSGADEKNSSSKSSLIFIVGRIGGRQAVEPAEDGCRRFRILPELCSNCGARLCVDRINQTEYQFDILSFLFAAMRRSLHIQIRQDPRQSRAHIDAVPAGQIDQAVDGNARGRLCHTHTPATTGWPTLAAAR